MVNEPTMVVLVSEPWTIRFYHSATIVDWLRICIHILSSVIRMWKSIELHFSVVDLTQMVFQCENWIVFFQRIVFSKDAAWSLRTWTEVIDEWRRSRFPVSRKHIPLKSKMEIIYISITFTEIIQIRHLLLFLASEQIDKVEIESNPSYRAHKYRNW